MVEQLTVFEYYNILLLFALTTQVLAISWNIGKIARAIDRQGNCRGTQEGE